MAGAQNSLGSNKDFGGQTDVFLFKNNVFLNNSRSKKELKVLGKEQKGQPGKGGPKVMEEEEEQEWCFRLFRTSSLFPFAFSAPGSCAAPASGALPLRILVRAGAGGCPTLLDPDVPHVRGCGDLKPHLPLEGHQPADPGERSVC